MLKFYTPVNEHATPQSVTLIANEWTGGAIPENALWLDLFQPTEEEAVQVEFNLGIHLPTPSEMQDIEISSRLYHDDKAAFMTITALVQQDTPEPTSVNTTFIIKNHKLVTLRYHEIRPFNAAASRMQKAGSLKCGTGEDIMLSLIEALTDRMADTLEHAALSLDAMSLQIFRSSPHNKNGTTSEELKTMLQRIGQTGDLLTRLRDSLVSLTRLLTFYATDHINENATIRQRETHNHSKSLSRDVSALNDQTAFLSSKVNFLLDATLGLISLEQNQIIKIFSVAATAFLPPTLIASIYGMNFHHMPELDWPYGYPMAIGLMLLSAILPFTYFKRRGWL